MKVGNDARDGSRVETGVFQGLCASFIPTGTHGTNLPVRTYCERGLSEVDEGGTIRGTLASARRGSEQGQHLSGGIESGNGVAIRIPNCGEDAGIQSLLWGNNLRSIL